MKKALIAALLLVLGSTVLGATVFRDQVAYAAQAVMPVLVTNDTRNPVPVREQGAVQVQPPAPITGGGGRFTLAAGLGGFNFDAPETATALAIDMTAGVEEVVLSYQGSVVGSFRGPAFGTAGSDSVDLALTRPITFDFIGCSAALGGGDTCSVGWIGAQP